MLISRNLNDRTYEEVIAEAVAQIPFYTGEWTNYNPSDPGITILENLSAFHVLQQSEINRVTDEVREKLLNMTGFYRRGGRMSRVLLEAENCGETGLAAGQKIVTGDICFELEEEARVNAGHILGMFSESQGNVRDISALTRRYGFPGGCRIFGDTPEMGDSIYFILDRLPPAGSPLILYMDIPEEYDRNPFGKKDRNLFAKLSWELLTSRGYKRIKVMDETYCFLRRGALKLHGKHYKGCPGEYAGMRGYIVRAVLQKADYDIAPRIDRVYGFLTEAVQMDTKAALFRFEGAGEIRVCHALAATPYFFVYGKETPGGDYREYRQDTGDGSPVSDGYYYRKERLEQGGYKLLFSREEYGHAPMAGMEEAVVVICCTEELMPHRKLGTAEGCDEQVISLSPYTGVVEDCFYLAAYKQDGTGNGSYSFWRPGCMEDGAVYYTLDSGKGKLTIHDCGDYEEAQLMIGALGVSLGADGNVLPENEFRTVSDGKELSFQNVYSNVTGRDEESLEEMRKRFAGDLSRPAAIVTAQDCEEVIRRISGLSIHKVKASVDGGKNVVNVAVKPNSREPYPALSDIYRKKIMECMNERRMLTVKMNILQPVYLPVHVKAVVYIRRHFENYREQIRRTLYDKLDYVSGDRNFGGLISFHEIYHALETLECVEEVYELSVRPGSMRYVHRQGMDYRLAENCLCYPGNMELKLSAKVYS